MGSRGRPFGRQGMGRQLDIGLFDMGCFDIWLFYPGQIDPGMRGRCAMRGWRGRAAMRRWWRHLCLGRTDGENAETQQSKKRQIEFPFHLSGFRKRQPAGTPHDGGQDNDYRRVSACGRRF